MQIRHYPVTVNAENMDMRSLQPLDFDILGRQSRFVDA